MLDTTVLIVPGVSVVKAIGLALAPIWLIWLAAQLKATQGPWIMPRVNVHLILAFGAFIASLLLSTFYGSISPFFLASATTIVLGITMAIVICTLVYSEPVLQRSYAFLATSGSIFGILIILQFIVPEIAEIFRQRVFLERIGETGETAVVRATGPFRDPNYAAFTLTVLACLSFYLALTRQRRWQRTLLFLGVAVQVVAILLTFSRGAYVVLGTTGLAVLWRERRRLRLRKAVLVVAISLVLLVVLGGGGIFKLVAYRAGTMSGFIQLLWYDPGQARQLDLSLWYRFQLLRAGVKMAFDKFPIGVGWENFRYQVPQYSREVQPLQGLTTGVLDR